MNRNILFPGALIAALLSLILAISSAVPGVYRVLVSGSHPPLDPHHVLLIVITAFSATVALVNRPNATHRS